MKKLILIILCSFGLCSNLYSECSVVNISPPNESIIYTHTPTFSWSYWGNYYCSPPCGGYYTGQLITLKIATDSLMNNVVYSWSTNQATNHTIPGNYLQSNIRYWWKVYFSFGYWCNWPCGGGGSCSASSIPFSFTPAIPPNSPYNLIALAVSSGRINLDWMDNSYDETGFKIERRIFTGGNWILTDSVRQNIVTYADTGLTANTIYLYRVYAYNAIANSPYSNAAFDTTFQAIGIIIINSEIPKEYKLYSNYPNPFNPATKIRFALPKSSFAKLVIYDILGREVEILVNEQLNAGTYEAEWNASKFSSGVYYYKLSTGDYVETKKMILIK